MGYLSPHPGKIDSEEPYLLVSQQQARDKGFFRSLQNLCDLDNICIGLIAAADGCPVVGTTVVDAAHVNVDLVGRGFPLRSGLDSDNLPRSQL